MESLPVGKLFLEISAIPVAEELGEVFFVLAVRMHDLAIEHGCAELGNATNEDRPHWTT